jgi:hypothetical protein
MELSRQLSHLRIATWFHGTQPDRIPYLDWVKIGEGLRRGVRCRRYRRGARAGIGEGYGAKGAPPD